MASVAFDTPPAGATRVRRASSLTIRTSPVATRIVIAIATLLILSTIAWNVAVETGSVLIGLGAADIAFLIAISFGLSLRGASRSARHARPRPR
ncbi:hypothetical protein [Sphingomonas sp. LaA6.9]|uniref:hypothetical protein n=1 Tax=Sphingomonas sp. LaA6.9 TaxID=2919914 RepID=UPI001F4F45D8|nr:hypothetical protein [Sphingomonas sp. LaA6.9]MCJ8158367.1 hypothetical protein [Sphingomonas sp. LaA6.9]